MELLKERNQSDPFQSNAPREGFGPPGEREKFPFSSYWAKRKQSWRIRYSLAFFLEYQGYGFFASLRMTVRVGRLPVRQFTFSVASPPVSFLPHFPFARGYPKGHTLLAVWMRGVQRGERFGIFPLWRVFAFFLHGQKEWPTAGYLFNCLWVEHWHCDI